MSPSIARRHKLTTLQQKHTLWQAYLGFSYLCGCGRPASNYAVSGRELGIHLFIIHSFQLSTTDYCIWPSSNHVFYLFFFFILCYYSSILSEVAFVSFCLKNKMNDKINDGLIKFRIPYILAYKSRPKNRVRMWSKIIDPRISRRWFLRTCTGYKLR